MPIYKRKDENFFKKWTPEMAYILGFFTADGNMIKNKRGAHFIEFCITDKNLLEKIRKVLKSNHKITVSNRNKKWNTSYRLQIGSKEIFNDLLKLGLTPRKSKTIKLPKIPCEYFSNFVRGYFDGDGCVSFGIYPRKTRKSNAHILRTRFISGNKKFLETLLNKLKRYADVKGGFIVNKNRGFELCFSINDSKILYRFMYSDAPKNLFLERKYNKFQEALKIKGT